MLIQETTVVFRLETLNYLFQRKQM